MLDFNDLAFFAEVVDRGGFAAASRSLGIPKSRLSRRVAELEARLGVRLLQRTTRKLSLTEAGQAYHRHCVAMREQAEAAEEAVALVHDTPRGTVKVTCPVTLAQSTIGPLVPRFLREYPQVRVEMEVTNRVVDVVQEGVDVALRVRATLEDSATLVVKNFGPSQALLVASPALLDRVGRPSAAKDLERVPSVAMGAVDGRATLPLRGPGGAAADITLRPVYVANDLLTLRFALLEGTGMGLLPDYLCARDLHEGRLAEVLPGWHPPVGYMHAVFASRRGMVPAVRRFLDFLGEHVHAEGIPAGCVEEGGAACAPA